MSSLQGSHFDCELGEKLFLQLVLTMLTENKQQKMINFFIRIDFKIDKKVVAYTHALGYCALLLV